MAVQTNIELFVIASSIFSVAVFRRIDSLRTHPQLWFAFCNFSQKSNPSGAFISLRCLIYKVHRSCGTFAILAHSLSFVKHFFENFFVFFGSARHSNQRFQNQLCYLTTLTGVCQALFSEAQWLSWISAVQIRLVFRSHSLAILAHSGPLVKNFFRKLFKSAISQEALAGLSRRQLW